MSQQILDQILQQYGDSPYLQMKLQHILNKYHFREQHGTALCSSMSLPEKTSLEDDMIDNILHKYELGRPLIGADYSEFRADFDQLSREQIQELFREVDLPYYHPSSSYEDLAMLYAHKIGGYQNPLDMNIDWNRVSAEAPSGSTYYYSLEELKRLASRLGLDIAGNKAEVANRLLAIRPQSRYPY